MARGDGKKKKKKQDCLQGPRAKGQSRAEIIGCDVVMVFWAARARARMA
jgi:hypothetical protein